MVKSTFTKQSYIGQEVISKAHQNTETTSGSNWEAEYSGNHTPLTSDNTHDNIGLYDSDTMMFLYPRYNGEADAEAHVRSFLNM